MERPNPETVLLNDILSTEKLLQALISNLPGGAAFVVDRDLRYWLAQGEALAIAGFKSEDFIGRTIFEVLPHEVAASYEPMYRQALAGKPFEHEHQAHNHSYISRGTPLRAETGEIYAVVVVSYDISDRKLIEATLRKSEERFRFFITASSDIVYTMSADWREMRSLKGKNFIVNTKNPSQTWIETYIPSEEQPRVLTAIQNAIRTKSPFELEHRMIQPDGAIGWTFSRAIPMLNDQGDIVEWFGTASDITERKRAEAALRESEAKYRSLFNSIDEGFHIIELIDNEAGEVVDYRFLGGNPAFERLTGLKNTAGKLGSEIAPQTESYWLDAYDRVARTGEPLRIENYNKDTQRWYSAYTSEIGGVGSRQVAIVFNDITERKQNEARQSFLLRMSDALRSLSAPVDIQETVTRTVMDHFGADRCYYCEIEDGNAIIRRDATREGLPTVAGVYPLSHFAILQAVVEAGRPFVVQDVHTTDTVDENLRQLCIQLQVISYIDVPVIKNGKPVGVLCLVQSTPRAWTQLEVELAIETADRTWAAVERARAETALRESEAKYRSLFNSIDEGFCIIERVAGELIDFRYIEANPAFAVQTGVSNVVGKTIREAFPDAPEAGYEIYENVLKTGEPIRSEIDVPSLKRTLEIYAFRTEDDPRLAVIFKDISERKRQEANLVFLAEVSQDLARLTNIDETMNVLGEKIGGYFNLSACVFAELSEMAEIALINYTWQLSHMPSFIGTYRMQDFVTPEVLQLCRAGEAVVIRDVFADPLVDGEQYAALKIGSFLSIPLVRDGEWRFLLVIYHTEPHDWHDDEIELTRELANRIWTRLERARAEIGLSQSKEKYRLLFNSITEGYALCELLYDDDERAINWQILQVNPAFESLTGLRDVAGKTGTQLSQPLNQNWLPTFGTVAQTGKSTRFEHYIDRVDSWFEILVSRIDEDKHHIVIVFNNITDAKHREAECKQAEADQMRLIQEQAAREQERQRAESLAELDRAKTQFFSNISHEFRTPLTLSLAPLQDALSDRTHPLAPVQRERLDLVHRNSLRLLKLVNTLLDFSRIEAGRMEAVYEPTDLARFTAELASVFRSAIERAGLALMVDCPPLPEPVYVDREMWEKIVLNLLSNALKFTFAGTITVKLYPADHAQVILEVQDTGTGIAPQHLPHLFERFYQIRGVQAHTQEGSGIGLALVYELVRLHGGTIDVNSTVEEGTCFMIALSLGSDHLPSDRLRRIVSDRNKPTPALASTSMGITYVEQAECWIVSEGKPEAQTKDHSNLQPPDSLDSAHILLVDDNGDLRDYLTRILSKFVQVEAVADGATALAAAQARVPDLVLTDVMMPRLDGFQLLQALRADPRTRSVPIILLSARAGEEAIVEGLEAGADDYLIKPFSAQELMSRVNAHLQIAQLRKETLDHERMISRRKDELLSIVSHELNTPLVAILGWTRLLRNNSPSPSMLMKALETIERNGTVQAKLIQDLLDISRINAGKVHLNLQPVDLEPILEVAIATVENMAQTQKIDLVWQGLINHQRNHGLVVLGDGDRLQQVICNLLTNAIKFTPAGGRVTVELCRSNGDLLCDLCYAEIRVIDTGIGIPVDFLAYVFDRFRQAQDSHSAQGLGLGLAIARHLIELHNGTIHVYSAGENQGTTFTIKLPLFPELSAKS